jgi:vacuolar-type H+-ATPase subunit H
MADILNDIQTWKNDKLKELKRGNELNDNSPEATTILADLIDSPDDLAMIRKAIIIKTLYPDQIEKVDDIITSISRKADLPRILGYIALSYPAALQARAQDGRSHFWIVAGPSGSGKTLSSEFLGKTLLNLHATAHKLISEGGHTRKEVNKIIAIAAQRDLKVYEPYIGKIDYDKYAKDFVDAVSNYGTSGGAAKVKSFVEVLDSGNKAFNVISFNGVYFEEDENGTAIVKNIKHALGPLVLLDNAFAESALKNKDDVDPDAVGRFVDLAGDTRNPVAQLIATENVRPLVVGEIIRIKQLEIRANRLGLLVHIHGQTERFKNESKKHGMIMAEQLRKVDDWNLFTRSVLDNDHESTAQLNKQLQAAGWSGDRIDRFKKDMKGRFLGVADKIQQHLKENEHENLANSKSFSADGIRNVLYKKTNSIYTNAITNPTELITKIEDGIRGKQKATGSKNTATYDYTASAAGLGLKKYIGSKEATNITHDLKEIINDFSSQLGFDSTIKEDKTEATGIGNKLRSKNKLESAGLLAKIAKKYGEEDLANKIVTNAKESVRKQVGDIVDDPKKLDEELRKEAEKVDNEYFQKLDKELKDSVSFDELKKKAENYRENLEKLGKELEKRSEASAFDYLVNEFDIGDPENPASNEVFDVTRRLSNSEACKIMTNSEFEQKRVNNPRLIKLMDNIEKVIAIDLSEFTSNSRRFLQLKELKKSLSNYVGEENAKKHIRNLILDMHGPSLTADLYMRAL